jgi:hypothetical protein
VKLSGGSGGHKQVNTHTHAQAYESGLNRKIVDSNNLGMKHI